jgi:hypothetical protein
MPHKTCQETTIQKVVFTFGLVAQSYRYCFDCLVSMQSCGDVPPSALSKSNESEEACGSIAINRGTAVAVKKRKQLV